jgi:3-oxoacyl-[acyl-carrier protein] reductase
MNKKVAVIIGGSSGIGETIARRFAREDIKVIVVASGSLAKAQAVADGLRAPGGDIGAKTADVRDASSVAALFKAIWNEEGSIDILVNCAGIFKPTPIGETDLAIADQMIDVNLRGTFHTINAAVPYMKKSGGGKIVNIASVAAVMGLSNYAVYCATKAAVSMMTRALAIDLAPHDININAIAPGNTATPMNEDIRFDPALADVLESITRKTPSRHIYSQPEDMAELAWYLTTPAARPMHGSTLLIDEGFSAGI